MWDTLNFLVYGHSVRICVSIVQVAVSREIADPPQLVLD